MRVGARSVGGGAGTACAFGGQRHSFRSFATVSPCWSDGSRVGASGVPVFVVFVVHFVSHDRPMGKNRKWVLEDNLSEAVWRTFLRGPHHRPIQ